MGLKQLLQGAAWAVCLAFAGGALAQGVPVPPGGEVPMPPPDRDGDDVPDHRDDCPGLAGNSSDGCPGPKDVKAIVRVVGENMKLFGTRGQVIDCTNPGFPWAEVCTEMVVRAQNYGLSILEGTGYEVNNGWPEPCEERERFFYGSKQCEPVYALDMQVNPFDYCRAAGWTSVWLRVNENQSTDDYWMLNVDCTHNSFSSEECEAQEEIAKYASAGFGIGALFKAGRWLSVPGAAVSVLMLGVDCDYKGTVIPID